MQLTDLSNTDIRVDLDGGIAILTLTRAGQGNAFTHAMSRQIQAFWDAVRDDQAVRVCVIAAEGDRHFCTGADLGGLNAQGEGGGMVNLPLDRAVYPSSRHAKVWKPVICAVSGLVAGGGLHFVVDSDIIVASANAAFVDTHVNVGQVGALENIGLAKRLPLGTALRMTLQGRKFRLDARRAWQLGLVDELVDEPSDVLLKAMEIARDIASASPQAVALSKQAVWSSLEMGYSMALEHGWTLLRAHWAHPDFGEGPAAFAERREPVWVSDPNARR